MNLLETDIKHFVRKNTHEESGEHIKPTYQYTIHCYFLSKNTTVHL